MKPKLLLAPVVFVALAGLSACAGNGYYAVRTAPPPPRSYGVVGVAPGPGYAWIDGFWDWRGGNWHWVNGYWARPPRPRAVWARPYWEPYGRGYRFHRGYWRYR